MPEFVTEDSVVTTLEVPAGPDSLFHAAALALRPQDPAHAPHRARQLRTAVLVHLRRHQDRHAGGLIALRRRLDPAADDEDPVSVALDLLARPDTPPGLESVRALAELLARPIRLLRPGACALVLRPGVACGGPRVLPVVLSAVLGAGPLAPSAYYHFDAVEAEAPLVFGLEPEADLPDPGAPPTPAVADAPVDSPSGGAGSPTCSRGSATPRTADLALTLPPPRAPALTPLLDHRPGVLRFATWNVQGCSPRALQLALDTMLAEEGVHLAVVQETRMAKQVTHTPNYRWVVEGTTPGGHRSTAVLVRRGLPNTWISSYAFPHRDVVSVRATVLGIPFSVVGAHVPCGTGRPPGPARQRAVLAALAAVVAALPRDRWRLVAGDFNAKLGRLDNPPCPQLGKHLLHPYSDDAGVALLQLAQQVNLPIVTTGRSAVRCRITRVCGTTESQLDHVLTDFPRVRQVIGLEPRHLHSDHRLIVAALDAPLARPYLPAGAPRTGGGPLLHPPRKEWDVRRLNTDVELQAEYAATLDALLGEQVSHARRPFTWRQLVDALRTAADGVLAVAPDPPTPRRRAAANATAAALTAYHRAGRAPYAADRLRAARSAQRAARLQHETEARGRFFAAVDDTRPVARMHVLFRHLRVARRQPPAARADGPTLRDWQQVADGLTVGDPVPLLDEQADPAAPAPTAAQLREYARTLSTNTAAGPDGLPGELFRHAPACFFELLSAVIGPAWESGDFPVEWITSVQQPIPKVQRPRTVGDYRTLTLGNVVYKLLAKHLHALLMAALPPIPLYQAGFQAERGTYDHVMLLRRVLDARWWAGDAVHVLALDIRSAFPSTRRRELAAVLLAEGLSPYLLNRVSSLALTDYTSIRWFAARTGVVRTALGVKQGCTLAPLLFTRALHWVIKAAVQGLARFRLDLSAPGFTPLLLAYADDLLVASVDLQDLHDFLEQFIAAAALMGLELNLAKCEYLVRTPYPEPGLQLPRPFNIAGKEVPQVDQLLYLGALITSGLDRRGTAYQRIHKARRAVAALQPLLQRHPLPPRVVARIWCTAILPSISYAHATVATTKATRTTLRRQASVMVASLMALARRDPRRRARLRGVDKKKGSITRAIRGCRVRYWAHIQRRPPGHPLRRVLDFEVGRKKQGRPCHRFNESLQEDFERLGPPEAGWAEAALSKTAFAAHVRDALDGDVSSEEELDSSADEWDDDVLDMPELDVE